jgi:hypothetical protein
VIGYSYLPTAVDDHSRLAYCEILADQRKDTAAALWRRARAWFTVAGITVERVMTGKRSLLQVLRLARCPGRRRHHPQAHPPLPAPDQRASTGLPRLELTH